jgi:hypothetical protein
MAKRKRRLLPEELEARAIIAFVRRDRVGATALSARTTTSDDGIFIEVQSHGETLANYEVKKGGRLRRGKPLPRSLW